MGEHLGEIYHSLWNECALLHMRWDEFVMMFGKDQEQFDVMNQVAPGFFMSAKDALWESILLHLCRFADPYRVAHRQTLSLEALLNCQASQSIPDLRSLVADAKSKIKFAQDWRNRALAHLDLEHALEKTAQPLAPASRLRVKEALLAISMTLQSVENHFTGVELGFGGVAYNFGGSHLLSELRLIAQLRQERDQRIYSGAGTADDFDHKKWH